ncbi:MAG: ribonuclease P protein component [Rickettsiales bacterium]
MKISSVKSVAKIKYLKSSKNKKSGKFITLVTAPFDNVPDINYLLIVTKKVGNAVIRNRAKRRLRALIYENRENMSPEIGYLFIAKNSIIDSNTTDLKEDFLNLITNDKITK